MQTNQKSNSASLKLKPMSIMDALKDTTTGELWVLNINKSRINKHSDLTRVQLATEKEKITIEATWIPQNLAELGTRDLIVNSVQFKSAVNQGLIKIIDPESAKQAFATSKAAQNEQLRIQTSRNVVIQYATSNYQAQQEMDMINEEQVPDSLKRRMQKLQKESQRHMEMNDAIDVDDLNPVVLSIMAQAEYSSSDQLYHSLRGCDDSLLSAKDYQHVYEVATQFQYRKLARWAERAVARKLTEAGGRDEDDGDEYAE